VRHLRPTGPPTASAGSKSPGGKTHRRRLARSRRLFAFDRGLQSRFVAGADEAGRGCLAGPLVAAAVLIDYERLSVADRRALSGLHDSKQMTEERRLEMYPCVLRAAERVSVVIRCAAGIDRRGLHVTNIEALSLALERLAPGGEAIALVDGFRLPRCAVPHRAVVQGDATSAAIAAASVIAKVTRDRYMRDVAEQHPGWGFEEHVGYSTPEHRAAIEEIGISPLHRRSFQSVAYAQLELG
jgi:ribonuclease HII